MYDLLQQIFLQYELLLLSEKLKDEIVRIALGTSDTFTHRDLIALVPDRKQCNHEWDMATTIEGETYQYCKKCEAET